MRRILSVIALIVGTAASMRGASPVAATAAPPAERFSFVALGCMPYGRENFAAYERLLAEINRRAPAFTVHCGDTKTGSEPPTEAFLVQVRTWFDSLDSPVVYTPGDNEWTDVHRTNNGRHDPLVWLGKVRTTYFAEERSMGRKPMPLVTQRRDPAFAKFVENARWSRGGVVFATVHVVGSNNNNQPGVPGAVEEFRERDAANAAWVRAAFAEARAAGAAGVALFFQAEPFASVNRKTEGSGFTRFLATVEAEARAFAKPVLLVHADAHRYRLERGMRFQRDAEPLANVTRLETFGAGDIHAVQVVVDPASPQVFLAGPLLVPDNALPVLPRK
ncbi:MAG: hypothetical protein HY736_23805 [Verrucomicrobia bacterium]|nr:hypothetical protein [Verrucomicrobiota bacterium]